MRITSKQEFRILFGNSPFKMTESPFQMNFHVAMAVTAVIATVLLLTAMAPDSTVYALAVSPALVAKRDELNAKQEVLGGVFEQAGDNLDFAKVKKIGEEDVSSWNTVKKTEKVRSLNAELEDLGQEVDGLVAAEKAKNNVDRLREKREGLKQPETTEETERRQIKTLGQRLVEIESFKDRVSDVREQNQSAAFKVDAWPSELLAAHVLKGNGDYLSKTLFETSAGWAPESTRTGLLVPGVTRPLQILDFIPVENTNQASVVYMAETTRTHASAEKAEGVAFAESTFVVAEQSQTVRKITDSIPVTDEQLEDVSMVEGYLSNRLTFGVRQRLDSQILTGSGVAPNLEGINNVSGIQTQAKGADSVPDAVYKAIVKCRVTGRAMPNLVVFHPNDWQGIRLLTTSDGIYIWGSPSEAGPMRIWGLNVVETDAQTENTGLVGDFANFVILWQRRGVMIEVGYVGTQFTEGKKTMRADMRAAVTTTRAAAFCQVTGV